MLLVVAADEVLSPLESSCGVELDEPCVRHPTASRSASVASMIPIQHDSSQEDPRQAADKRVWSRRQRSALARPRIAQQRLPRLVVGFG